MTNSWPSAVDITDVWTLTAHRLRLVRDLARPVRPIGSQINGDAIVGGCRRQAQALPGTLIEVA